MTAHREPTSLTVMTLNLWGANKWRRRRGAVVEWINEVQPDLVALQEVVRRVTLRQAAWIARHTGMTAVFGPARATFSGTFGNAVLSRLPVTASRCHALTDASSGNEPRALLSVDVETAGHRISFSSTHLSWQFDEGWVREQQVRDIADVIPHTDDVWTIVCGDFNAEPDSAEIRFLTRPDSHLVDAFAVANPEVPGHTWSNANPFAAAEREPDRRIDYIFVGTGLAAGRVLGADVVCNAPRGGVWPTDHFGVAAQLSLSDE
ncbi:MAG TPA: endonuclease/exonuclease/phosphatase family protein [Mycobacterium sp.]|nr:endonuclease/exonuclease/phosphatase family protein [Mycobacterium sp.]